MPFQRFLFTEKINKYFVAKKKIKDIFFSSPKARGLYFSSSSQASRQFVPEQIFSPLWPIINPTTLLIITYLPKVYYTMS